jgi:hypothetical protein
VTRIPLGGVSDAGAATTIASGQGSFIGGLAVDSSYVYWTSPSIGGALRAPLGGGPAVTLATAAASFPMGIAVDANAVYWANENALDVVKLSPK